MHLLIRDASLNRLDKKIEHAPHRRKNKIKFILLKNYGKGRLLFLLSVF